MRFEQVDDNPEIKGSRFVDLDQVTGISVQVLAQPRVTDIRDLLKAGTQPKQTEPAPPKVVVTLSFGSCIDTKSFDTQALADSWLAEHFSLGNVVYF